MLFNSLTFLVFFPLVTGAFYLLPHRYRWGMLLAASCYFYMAFIPVYIAILAVTIAIDYLAAIMIEDTNDASRRKLYLITSVVSTCLVLFIFKYYNFFTDNLRHVATLCGWNYPLSMLGLILPIGLSFHTFQSLSYVIEVYWRRQKAERHFGIYALYVMFYPQLVAGPIERPQNLLHQFREHHPFVMANLTNGIKLMMWGMFKKVVIADRVSVFVNHAYGTPGETSGVGLLFATMLFSFQIYCDFSGYSDIAIGAAQAMGFRLMDNFNRPYFSKSVAEFWKRWHISLSSWFRDYLYIPLGGGRVSPAKVRRNVFITFLVSGIWHGANWTYIIWGALNGLYIIGGQAVQPWRNALFRSTMFAWLLPVRKYLRIGTTFALVTFAWVFFRAPSVQDALTIIARMLVDVPSYLFSMGTMTFHQLLGPFLLGQSAVQLVVVLCALGVLEAVHLLQRHGSIRAMLTDRPWPLRWAVIGVLLVTIIFFGRFSHSQFIYFQF